MNALSRLITKVTKRQFSMVRDIESYSVILDRTISFAESGKLSEEQVEDIATVIPVVDPVTEQGEPDVHDAE